ncbi:MAG: PLP-dependent transferase [Xanthomonadales bacterium]|nr:PLP-dependent transferase [Xanthomonadales bacterium]
MSRRSPSSPAVKCAICDNGFATPLNSHRSLSVDLIVHSATKYLNGHSDVVAGMLCGSEKIPARNVQGSVQDIRRDSLAARCMVDDQK